jgi:glycosyltransferase involved in cell wall biosynthesis
MSINLSCPINNTGYGLASLNILKELSIMDTVVYFPIGQPQVTKQEDYEKIIECYNNRSVCNINDPYLKIWHQFDLLEHMGRGQYYAYSFFELDSFNDYELLNFSVPDSLFVTSEWAKNVLLKHNINKNIHIAPLGVDRKIFNENIKPNINHDDKYIFLNIGKWEVRKGHDVLRSLFDKAFPNQKDVELWLVPSEKTNNYSSEKDLEEWKKMYSGTNIKIFTGFDTQEEIAQLISQSSCGIYPSRAEGWNLELLETMSMNKPCICTNFSAHTEFCNNKNSFLIDISETELAYDGKAFRKQGNWAKIGQEQEDHIIDCMRYVYNHRILSNIEGVKTAKTYSWENTAKTIYGCIS